MVGSPPDIDGLSPDDLKKLVFQLLEEVAALKGENAALRDEIARLKGLKGRPKLKPSGMEAKTESKARKDRKGRRRGAKNARLIIDEVRIIEAEVPAGSRFKGYEDYVAQDLIVRPWVVRYRRERWRTPSGETVTAPLPAGIVGHVGPTLRRFVLMQYHQGQVTMPRLVAQLREFGVAISKRQVVRLLIAGHDAFLDEAQAVLRAGLAGARWITVDDTGARHDGRNGVCTRIGNDRFCWFATTFSKSRLNFLELLRAGYGDYVINDAALAYMRGRNLSRRVIARLAEHEQKRFADAAAWTAHLQALGITGLHVHPDPPTIATEGALWGAIDAHGLLRDTVIVSDGAGQFKLGLHGLCWVHAERLVHKLDAFSDAQRRAKERIRARLWRLYADLKGYCRDPTSGRKRQLRARFDRLFTTRTGFVTLDRLLARHHANKDDLLVALDRPEVPMHTNDVENDIRCHVTRRKISAGTRSARGRDCRDAFLGLMKTATKHGISFWDYLGDRLSVPGAPAVPYLPDLVRQPATP